MVVNGVSIGLGAGVFAFVFLLHVLLWNSFAIKRQLLGLLVLFLGVPLIIYFLFSLLGAFYFSSLLLTLVLGVNYISIYPAIQASSPTLVILAELYKRKTLSVAEIHQFFDHGKLIQERVEDLQKGGMIFIEQNQFRLTPKANALAGVFIFYRNLLKMPEGAG